MKHKFKNWTDLPSIPLAEFLTSTLFVIIVMLTFIGGIVTHLQEVFDSWFLMTISLTKAFAVSTMELMFSYLFNARWNTDQRRFVGIKTKFQKDMVTQTDEDELSEYERVCRRKEALEKYDTEELKESEEIVDDLENSFDNEELKVDDEKNNMYVEEIDQS